ncbi:MAG: L-histidine N(alpha)-methyltransferase, partial [Pseudomonadota bacterium]
ITVGGATFPFLEGETIHTENSYKYGIREFQELAASAGFVPARAWTDPERLFSLHYLTVH